jgi:hypothetical protein
MPNKLPNWLLVVIDGFELNGFELNGLRLNGLQLKGANGVA